MVSSTEGFYDMSCFGTGHRGVVCYIAPPTPVLVPPDNHAPLGRVLEEII